MSCCARHVRVSLLCVCMYVCVVCVCCVCMCFFLFVCAHSRRRQNAVEGRRANDQRTSPTTHIHYSGPPRLFFVNLSPLLVCVRVWVLRLAHTLVHMRPAHTTYARTRLISLSLPLSDFLFRSHLPTLLPITVTQVLLQLPRRIALKWPPLTHLPLPSAPLL